MINYLIAFLQGILTFISPCILPLIPVFIFYLAADKKPGENKKVLIFNVLAFIFGFTLIFTLLGATATALGSFLSSNIDLLRKISGTIMVVIGLNFLGIIKIGFLNRSRVKDVSEKVSFGKAFLFGLTFAFAWSPCLTAFLGNTLALAANQDTVLKGSILLFVFSLGLGVPFLLTSILYDKLTDAFDFIKKNYKVIRIISGVLMIVAGLLVFFDYIKYLS